MRCNTSSDTRPRLVLQPTPTPPGTRGQEIREGKDTKDRPPVRVSFKIPRSSDVRGHEGQLPCPTWPRHCRSGGTAKQRAPMCRYLHLAVPLSQTVGMAWGRVTNDSNRGSKLVGYFSISSLTVTATQPSHFYDNAWTIGIVTGLASGLILTLITPIFLHRRRARETALRRERAGEDFLSSLRPTVGTQDFPAAQMVESAWRASAFKRDLDLKLAIPASTLLDVLASEVLASSFVSSESRIDMVDKILSLRASLGSTPEAVEEPTSTAYPADKLTTAAYAVLGACVVGASTTIFVLTGNVLAVAVIAGFVLVLITLLIITPAMRDSVLLQTEARTSQRRVARPEPPGKIH
jgi:hypothetical protein